MSIHQYMSLFTMLFCWHIIQTVIKISCLFFFNLFFKCTRAYSFQSYWKSQPLSISWHSGFFTVFLRQSHIVHCVHNLFLLHDHMQQLFHTVSCYDCPWVLQLHPLTTSNSSEADKNGQRPDSKCIYVRNANTSCLCPGFCNAEVIRLIKNNNTLPSA